MTTIMTPEEIATLDRCIEDLGLHDAPWSSHASTVRRGVQAMFATIEALRTENEAVLRRAEAAEHDWQVSDQRLNEALALALDARSHSPERARDMLRDIIAVLAGRKCTLTAGCVLDEHGDDPEGCAEVPF